MANQYDTNLKLQAIADAIGNSQSSGLISALEDIADAVAGGGGGSSAGLVSDNFSETDTYDLGDYCIHNNTLYVCINAITTPGPWDLSDWQATNAGIQLSSLNSAISKHYNSNNTRVNISSYNSANNQYTCPSDGYVNISANGSGSNITIIYGGIAISATGYTEGGLGKWDYNAMFIRKGSQIYVYTVAGTTSAYFFPLSDEP